MSTADAGATRRLERLERVLAGRRARLASALARQQRRVSGRPVGPLERYGYSVAVLLAVTAVLPTVLGFAARRRRLLFGIATNRLGISLLRRRFDAARSGSTR